MPLAARAAVELVGVALVRVKVDRAAEVLVEGVDVLEEARGGTVAEEALVGLTVGVPRALRGGVGGLRGVLHVAEEALVGVGEDVVVVAFGDEAVDALTVHPARAGARLQVEDGGGGRHEEAWARGAETRRGAGDVGRSVNGRTEMLWKRQSQQDH